MENKIISPCISICRTDPVTGYCYGCARTTEEKKLWKDDKIELSYVLITMSVTLIFGLLEGIFLGVLIKHLGDYFFKKNINLS